jgi:hypothetical protein
MHATVVFERRAEGGGGGLGASSAGTSLVEASGPLLGEEVEARARHDEHSRADAEADGREAQLLFARGVAV